MLDFLKASRRSVIIAAASVTLALQAPVANAETFTLVTGDDYAPFTTSAKPNGGLATDIIRSVFREMGHSTQVEFKPWKRGYQDALAGKYLGTFPYAKNQKRLEQFDYSDPLYEVKLYFFAAEGSDVKFESEEDLKDRKFCVPLGYNPVKLIAMQEAGTIAALVRPQKLANCFQMLKKNRVDFVRVNDMIGWSEINKTFGGGDGFRLLDKPFDDGSAEYLIISKSMEGGGDLLEAFNASLAKMKSDGRFHRLIERNLK
ncbi:MAG: ABC transporter substrate-binding protein [Pseudomonadota bacterium]